LEKISINTTGFNSEIFIGENWEAVSGLIPENKTVIVTDDNVNQLYGVRFPKFPIFSLLPERQAKNLESSEHLPKK